MLFSKMSDKYQSKLLGLYLLSGRTSYGKISRSLEAARLSFKLVPSLWNLTGISAAPLPRCLWNFRAIRSIQHPISRLRDFARFGGKTSYRLVNRGPGTERILHRLLYSIFFSLVSSKKILSCRTYVFWSSSYFGVPLICKHSGCVIVTHEANTSQKSSEQMGGRCCVCRMYTFLVWLVHCGIWNRFIVWFVNEVNFIWRWY